jgi:hypothetical protein
MAGSWSHFFASRRLVIESAFIDDRVSLQMCLELEKSLSTETDVPMIARKSCAIRAMTGNSFA